MPRKVPLANIRQYWRWRAQGLSIEDSCKKAGFSLSYGKGLEKKAKGDNSSPGSRPDRYREEFPVVGPKSTDELSAVARDCLDDFARFRARYLGSISVPWQEQCAQRIRALLETGEREYAVINVAQGAGKTRFFSHDVPAWLTVRDRTMRGILGSNALHVANGLTENLRDTLTRTVPALARESDKKRDLAIDAVATLPGDYGQFKPTADENNLWRRDRFTVAQHGGVATTNKEPTWASFSYEAKFLGWRVDFMNWDDLVDTRMLENPDMVTKLTRWWDIEAESRLDPGGLCLLVGQRLRSNDIYRYCLDKAAITDEMWIDNTIVDDTTPRMYHHIIYKAHYPEHCHEQHAKTDPPYLEGGCLLDPKRVDWSTLRSKMNSGTYEVVMQQEDSDPKGVLVPKTWIEGGELNGVTYLGAWDDKRAIRQIPAVPPGSFTVRYMTVDPSPTKYWGILDWLYVLPPDTEPLAGYRYLLDIHRDRMQVDEFLEWDRSQHGYTGLAEDWAQAARARGAPIEYLIMEKNAAQRWAMQYGFFVEWAQTRGIQVIKHETESNKADPEFGVWATIPNQFRHGRVRLPGEHASGSRIAVYPLVGELTTYPDGSTNDLVMSMWFGEYNLQHLVHSARRMGNIHGDMPAWARDLEAVGGI